MSTLLDSTIEELSTDEEYSISLENENNLFLDSTLEELSTDVDYSTTLEKIDDHLLTISNYISSIQVCLFIIILGGVLTWVSRLFRN